MDVDAFITAGNILADQVGFAFLKKKWMPNLEVYNMKRKEDNDAIHSLSNKTVCLVGGMTFSLSEILKEHNNTVLYIRGHADQKVEGARKFRDGRGIFTFIVEFYSPSWKMTLEERNIMKILADNLDSYYYGDCAMDARFLRPGLSECGYSDSAPETIAAIKTYYELDEILEKGKLSYDKMHGEFMDHYFGRVKTIDTTLGRINYLQCRENEDLRRFVAMVYQYPPGADAIGCVVRYNSTENKTYITIRSGNDNVNATKILRAITASAGGGSKWCVGCPFDGKLTIDQIFNPILKVPATA